MSKQAKKKKKLFHRNPPQENAAVESEWSFEDEDRVEIVWVSRCYSGNRRRIVGLSAKHKCNQVALTQTSPVRTDILLSQLLHPVSSNLRRECNDFFQNRKNFIHKSNFTFKPLWSLFNNSTNNMQYYNPTTLWTYSDWFTPRAPANSRDHKELDYSSCSWKTYHKLVKKACSWWKTYISGLVKIQSQQKKRRKKKTEYIWPETKSLTSCQHISSTSVYQLGCFVRELPTRSTEQIRSDFFSCHFSQLERLSVSVSGDIWGVSVFNWALAKAGREQRQ